MGQHFEELVWMSLARMSAGLEVEVPWVAFPTGASYLADLDF